jgi:hypothetical protein
MNIIKFYLCKHPYIEIDISKEILDLRAKEVECLISVGKVYVSQGKPTVKANLDVRITSDLLSESSFSNKDIFIFSGDIDFLYPVDIYNYQSSYLDKNSNNSSLCRFIYWPLYCNREISDKYIYLPDKLENRYIKVPLLCPYEERREIEQYNSEYVLLIDANNILGRLDNDYYQLINVVKDTISSLDCIYK